MNAITVRNLSQRAFEAITELAARDAVSIEDEATFLLERAVTPQVNRHDRLRIADEIAAMTPAGMRQIDSTLLIREDRDR